MLVLEVLEKSETKVEDEILGECPPSAIDQLIYETISAKLHRMYLVRRWIVPGCFALLSDVLLLFQGESHRMD